MLLNNIIEAIGKTPILKLSNFLASSCATACNCEKSDTGCDCGKTDIGCGCASSNIGGIYAKLEYFNPLSSIKDRASLFMIEDAEKSGKLKKGGTIIEPTSGNTGIGLAYVARQKGYKVVLTMPESMSEERKLLLKALGAELVLTPKGEGMMAAISKAKELNLTIPNSYIPMQFENESNSLAHMMTTAPEILEDLKGITIDYFVAGVGSGGTLMGVGKTLKKFFPNIQIVAVEPYESPILSGGQSGSHGIQGIGANFIPKLIDMSIIDKIITVKSADAILTAKDAIKSEGLSCGISSGANLFASRLIYSQYPNANIVTILPDTAERYMSTALFH